MKAPRWLPPHAALLILLVLAIVAFAGYQMRAARLTMTNAGIAVHYAPASAVLLLSCAFAMALVAVPARARPLRGLALALALGTLLAGLETLTFRIAAEPGGLRVHRLTKRTVLPWSQIAKVENEPFAVVLVDLGGRALRLDLAGFTAQQRAAFDRTLARRIWESGGSHEE